MSTSAGCCSGLVHLFKIFRQLAVDLSRLLLLAAKSRRALAAENLFLRKQLALFQEREVPPHRVTDATRWLMVFLGKFFEWRSALVLVKPETLIGGIEKVSVCSGAGSPGREDGPNSRSIFNSSSVRWAPTIQRGVKRGSPMNYS